jgi:alkanesulfonate monooxygenase SsuD/methylene tetrahydromethanopterin reductase-like flavin-dependent oxidoreductase (luciferase family)
VHHFARQLASPFPLLAAVGARTSRIEIGTGVIDMRYENPLYMAEDAGSADLIAGGRLQLGISRGSPEQVIDGWRHFGYAPPEGQSDADMGRRHAEVFLETAARRGFRQAQSAADVPQPARAAAARAAFRGLARADLVGLGLQRHRRLGGQAGHESAELDAQGRRKRRALPHPAGEADPHLSRGLEGGRPCARAARLGQPQHLRAGRRSRPRLFRARQQSSDQIGVIDDTKAIFGRTYAAEPDKLIKELAQDEAIAEADTLLLTVPNQLGVDYNAHVIESILTHVAEASTKPSPPPFRQRLGVGWLERAPAPGANARAG